MPSAERVVRASLETLPTHAPAKHSGFCGHEVSAIWHMARRTQQLSVLALLLLSACTPPGAGSEGADSFATVGEPAESSGVVDGPADSGDATPSPAAAGLPCEVADLLATHCSACHGDPPFAPMQMLGRGDLLAPAPTQADLSVGELAAMRMRDSVAPMPPAAMLPEGAIVAFEAWIADGMPADSCGEPAPGDGATGEEADSRCSSNAYWDRKDDGNPIMHPGRACLDCHATQMVDRPGDEDIPNLRIGGTVYPSLHEPDDCVSDQVTDVVIRIKSMGGGGQIELVPNASGNFLVPADQAADLTPPFHVEVRRGNKHHEMPIPAPHGDCNACHTEFGHNGAPGRITVP